MHSSSRGNRLVAILICLTLSFGHASFGVISNHKLSRRSTIHIGFSACAGALLAGGILYWQANSFRAHPIRAHDLSLPIRPGMTRYPGDPDPEFTTERLPFSTSVSLLMSKINVSVHAGTHIDAPAHFIDGGRTVDKIAPAEFMGEVVVVDLENIGGREISRNDLEQKQIPIGSHLFIRTRNSHLLGEGNYVLGHVYLDFSAADYLIRDRRVRLLGFDYYNIDSSMEENLSSHTAFAKADIPVICALNLSGIQEGKYNFSAAPLSLNGLEASPLRVFIWDLRDGIF